MRRIWVGGALVGAWIAILAMNPVQGFDVSCRVDGCFFSAGTSPAALIMACVLIAAIFLVPRKAGKTLDATPVRIWERFAAFCIDYLIVFVISLPIVIFPALLVESMTTGSFQWSFYRDFLRPTDWFLVPVVLVVFAILFAYFYIHPVIGWRTIGQRILGYRLEADPRGGRPAFGFNIFLAFVGLCAWPISLYLAANREDKAFWWSLRTGIRAVRMEQ